ncbi:MAG: YkgJ family cysteine cluster protein [Candidatus Bathyarchaeota archaeon]|jgi:Fe-S-cluster containining protein|nr:YkgJ family cysteine cluster protein [Candidatus Termiticorpusculum sp.]MCL2256645.1 YkgJ family cysteine cluster protein [Candidatus Termiticorpusculum sp.]MCL2293176.1 YkgJ family cysteine cluster protein [Candidatus Termiticorpusculum sp.]
MLLTIEDIKRIEKRGFHKKYFLKIDKEGYAQLKNRNGYCAFYDLEKHSCSIYLDRPSGCGVYPVILDEAVGIIIDDICPQKMTITLEEQKEKGKTVIRLLEVIDAEAKDRC